VQRLSDDPNACYAFIGGALEFGELMEERLRQEYREDGVPLRNQLTQFLTQHP
jgi:ADP-ribose pyrophosphatase YjhB (NUDIX family)